MFTFQRLVILFQKQRNTGKTNTWSVLNKVDFAD